MCTSSSSVVLSSSNGVCVSSAWSSRVILASSTDEFRIDSSRSGAGAPPVGSSQSSVDAWPTAVSAASRAPTPPSLAEPRPSATAATMASAVSFGMWTKQEKSWQSSSFARCRDPVTEP